MPQPQMDETILKNKFNSSYRTLSTVLGLILILVLGAVFSNLFPLGQLPRGWHILWCGIIVMFLMLTGFLYALPIKFFPPDATTAPKIIRYTRWGCFCGFLLAASVAILGILGFCAAFMWVFLLRETHLFNNVAKAFMAPDSRLAKIIKYPFQTPYDYWQLLKFFSLFVSALALFSIWVEWDLMQTAPQHVTPYGETLLYWTILITPFLLLLCIAAWFTRPQENPSALQKFLRMYLLLWVKYIAILLDLHQLIYEPAWVGQYLHQSNLWYWWLSHPNEPYPQHLLAPIQEVHPETDLAANCQEEKDSPAPHRVNTSPLYLLVLSRDVHQINQAIQNGADVNEPYPQNGNTPLHIAALNGYADIVKLLLAQPAIEKNRPNLEGKTALDLAKERQQKEIIRLLE